MTQKAKLGLNLCNVADGEATLSTQISGLIVTGCSTFMGKYLERQFGVAPSKANMLIGGIMVPMVRTESLTLISLLLLCSPFAGRDRDYARRIHDPPLPDELRPHSAVLCGSNRLLPTPLAYVLHLL